MSFQSLHLGQALDGEPPDLALPAPIDSETAVLLRGFLLECFDRAVSWDDLRARLAAKGYSLGFRSGHLVVIGDRGQALCTGAMLGSPLSALAQRLGRPRIRSDVRGAAGQLQT